MLPELAVENRSFAGKSHPFQGSKEALQVECDQNKVAIEFKFERIKLSSTLPHHEIVRVFSARLRRSHRSGTFQDGTHHQRCTRLEISGYRFDCR